MDRCGTDQWSGGQTCSIPWLASGVAKQIAGCTECSCARATSARSIRWVSPLSSVADLTCGRPTPHRRCRRFLDEKHPLEPPDVAIVEQPTDHALWDIARALCIEFMAGGEAEPIIEPVNSCCHAGADERRRLDHRGTGEAAVRMTIIQPKESHTPNLAPGISGLEGGKLSLRRTAVEQFRQLCEIDRLLPRLAR
jgi:hypothetical protein